MSRDIGIEIPLQFEESLKLNSALLSLVTSSLDEFGKWLGANNLRFFTEYTEHGLQHVEDVVTRAYELIRDECMAIITAQDVATLILAALLHDCAMHLTKDGFVNLVRPDADGETVSGFDDKSWSELWQDFRAEVRQFSARRWKDICGIPEPVDLPQLDSLDITERQSFLIGEFLRRHHHRLAHEIALYGVPGPTEDRIRLNTKGETEHIADLAGLIARSHGLPMRSCLDYLSSKYSSDKTQRGVHTVFLMGLLRISDVLQIQAERASQQDRKVRVIRSPVSRAEWEAHQAVKDIITDKYPETVFIHAEPPDVRTYLKVKELLFRIQDELDEAWTVVGEVYAYVPKFKELGFKIRRIRSNLDDERAFGATVDYVPCSAAFDVADSDLLKLLIKPLYGNKPEIGIRELLQNSVDAVRELREYLKQNPSQDEIEFTEQKGDVVISIDQEEDGSWWVTVSDRGIGMTIDSVREYFLKAGACLRRSEIWRQTFEDEKGKSRVLRSGRFGIGALAAFLLGDKIHVSTRHVSARDSGVEFEAEIDTQAIELRRIERPVGTTIRVQITDKVRAELMRKGYGSDGIPNEEWDWYCLEDPKVVRLISHQELSQKYQLPSLDSELPAGWHRIGHPDFRDIHWTHLHSAPYLVCNGIRVMTHHGVMMYYADRLGVTEPKVSVFDSDSKLPLDLQRTGLTEPEYSFHKVLIDDVWRDFIAFALFDAPSRPIHEEPTSCWYWWYHYPVYAPGGDFYIGVPYMIRLSRWFSTPSGLSLTDDPWHIRQMNAKCAFLCDYVGGPSFIRNFGVVKNHVCSYSPSFRFEDATMQQITKDPVIGFSLSSDMSRISMVSDEVVRFTEKMYFAFGTYDEDNVYDMMTPGRLSTLHYGIFRGSAVSGRRVLVSRNGLDQVSILEKQQNSLPEEFMTLWQNFISQIHKEWENEDWVILRSGDCPSLEGDLVDIAERTPLSEDTGQYAILAKWYFGDNDQEIEISPLARIWEDLIGSPIIPYDLKERRQKLARAYKELKLYIEAYEATMERFEDWVKNLPRR